MTPQRARELETVLGATLTEEELREGWHFCPDWDYMLVNKYDEDSPEAAGCLCPRRPREVK